MNKIIGIGIDIIDVKRFEKMKYEENKKFYSKIFSDEEIQYCLKFKNPYERFAGKFALKEATIKAVNHRISMPEIETNHINSKPIVTIKNNNDIEFKVSLTHDLKIAVGVVISFLKN